MNRRAVLAVATVVLAGAGVATGTAAAPAQTLDPTVNRVDRALGNGLGNLLPSAVHRRVAVRDTGVRVGQSVDPIEDAHGRLLVDATPQAGADLRAGAEAAGLAVEAVDPHTGTLEGFLARSDIARVAALPGLGSLRLVPRPQLHAGSVQSQGVAFHNVGKVLAQGIDGKGITVGVISDSFDRATVGEDGKPITDHAAQDIASGELPGPGNAQYPDPVVVLQDASAADDPTDEGRAMLQIVHDMAPAAHLCFATANGGEVSFADNIRALADPAGSCRADVVVDDVSYSDEPAFDDGVIGRAVDDVAAEGVSYFSAAGNDAASTGWSSGVQLMSAAKAAARSNLKLDEVPADLISGGLQDMDRGPGVDPAQSVTVGDGTQLALQWDDPSDLGGGTFGTPIYEADGQLTPKTAAIDFDYTPPAADLGKHVQVKVDGVPTGSVDLILTVTRPDGSVIGPIDTGTSPERAGLTLAEKGTYRISVSGFNGSAGAFTVQVEPVITPSKVTTDFNLLVFSPSGHFLGSTTDDNTVTGQPSDLLPLGGAGPVQLVIAKAGTAPTPPRVVRYVVLQGGDLVQSEYRQPLAPAIYGHAAAAGANAVAAYDTFGPFTPESFTSPGGRIAFPFDAQGNRLATPVYRLKPEIAAADGVNTSFFDVDSPQDADSLPNFYGTSAAAPHAAAIAALLLQKAGGPRSLTPAAVTRRLQDSAFAHDLDPQHAAGVSGGVRLSADGADSDTGSETRFFSLRYLGRVPLRSLTLYGQTAAPTALGALRPPASDGIVFDPRAGKNAPGFPFTVGAVHGVVRSSVRASYLVPYRKTGTFRELELTFTRGLGNEAIVQFGVDRDLAVPYAGGAPSGGNSADLLGGGVYLPSGRVVPHGLTFRAVRVDGTVVTGAFVNRVGTGWSPVDGYGVADAARAVLG